jgi:hypothetical protein
MFAWLKKSRTALNIVGSVTASMAAVAAMTGVGAPVALILAGISGLTYGAANIRTPQDRQAMERMVNGAKDVAEGVKQIKAMKK